MDEKTDVKSLTSKFSAEISDGDVKDFKVFFFFHFGHTGST